MKNYLFIMLYMSCFVLCNPSIVYKSHMILLQPCFSLLHHMTHRFPGSQGSSQGGGAGGGASNAQGLEDDQEDDLYN